MFCNQCGKNTSADERFCSGCGLPIMTSQAQSPTTPMSNTVGTDWAGPNHQWGQQQQSPYMGSQWGSQQPVPQKNTIALVGFIFSFFIPIVGFICSIIGLNKASQVGGAGKGFAIAGICISAAMQVLNIIALSQGWFDGLLD